MMVQLVLNRVNTNLCLISDSGPPKPPDRNVPGMCLCQKHNAHNMRDLS